ncbi:cysteine-rich receptor-like protein kinase 25 [Gossypium australe]|uniref:Cysteine-rich receptor-like protein kinase 25 n=1 Tax=Gossypium australe TaxID=47621 RepID=A0A5B6WBU8_9ROSI|nr:cysteine-rich receptor-like protein kinase 25 [Gossypium australe]
MVSFDIPRNLLFYIFICLMLSLSSEAAVVFLYNNCNPNTTTYTRNSPYRRNLNILLSSFQSNSTRQSGFYNLTVGQAPPDIVYGLFLCRGDVTKEICRECVRTASGQILQRCPNQKTALVYYDECTIRYSNSSFFSEWEQEPVLELLNTGNVSQPERFMQLLGNTMNEIATRAAKGDQLGKKYATQEVNFTAFQTLYTLAQCTPDLSVYELYPFYRFTTQQLPPPPPVLHPPPALESKGKNKNSSTTIIAIVLPVVVSVVIFAGGLICILTRKSKKYDAVEQENGKEWYRVLVIYDSMLSIQKANIQYLLCFYMAGNEITTMESLQFDFSTIEAATNKFSVDNKLGEGGFGPVYKGKLPNGQQIAVKRLAVSSSQGLEEYKNEVALLAKLQHRNLVRLLGFCLEGAEKLLVYEFVPNKSLNYFLFDPEKQGELTWTKRCMIIGGIARGILYLHEDSRLKIIHRDLKISNILLDKDMNPKISDFGMARIFGVDQSKATTSRIVGTYGYMPPEYAMHGHFSIKSDVFSFGVIILEIITGKKSSNFQQSDEDEDLLSHVWKHWNNGTPLELLDPSLGNSYSRIEVIRCIHIGLLCVQEDPSQRPTMENIVLMLNSYTITLVAPQRPATFLIPTTDSNFTANELVSDQSGPSESIPWSVNQVSISDMDPRTNAFVGDRIWDANEAKRDKFFLI